MKNDLTRRELLKWLGVSGAGIALFTILPACAKPLTDSTGSSSGTGGQSSSTSSKTAPTKTIQMWGVGTVTLEDWKDFAKLVGIQVVFTASPDMPNQIMNEIVVQGAATRYDTLVSDGGIQEEMGPKGYFLPIDTSKLKNWAGVPETLKKSPLMWADGKLWGVPAVYNADSLGYYPDDLGTVDSFKVLFDDKRTMGKVGLEDNWLTTLPMAALYLKGNGLAQIGNPSDMTEKEVKMVIDFLIKRKKAGQFRALWSSWEEAVDLMAKREVIAENCWEPVVLELRKQGKNVQYAWTKEGYNKWVIAAWILKGAQDHQNMDAVYAVLDGLLGGYYGAQIGITRGYATGRPDLAVQYVKDHPAEFKSEDIKALEDNAKKVEVKFAAPDFWQNANPKNRKFIEQEWERFRQS